MPQLVWSNRSTFLNPPRGNDQRNFPGKGVAGGQSKKIWNRLIILPLGSVSFSFSLRGARVEFPCTYSPLGWRVEKKCCGKWQVECWDGKIQISNFYKHSFQVAPACLKKRDWTLRAGASLWSFETVFWEPERFKNGKIHEIHDLHIFHGAPCLNSPVA